MVMVSHAAAQQGSSGSGYGSGGHGKASSGSSGHGSGGAHNSGGHGHGSGGHGSAGHGKAEKKERSHTPGHGQPHAHAPSSSQGSGQVAAPGTPSRREERERHKAEKAVQDPGLKDYRLGECLGKGAFGSVYKAFNWGTGEAVAIKQIKIADLPKSELRMIEAEIDLLKNLNHDNIVKYLGFVKSPECLNIILEYCENGSLHSICKNFGKFPENLVGVYMTQILQGLLYLHDQGVIHRDIKGANILTTKDGKVKLADFGVSTSTLAATGDKEAQVVGTPYWMAPEVIQLSGATTASDIWSLGCTVIELLEGKPPYHKLAPMPALFAIVNDDHPPLPEGVSPAARDFLMQCFQKDPNLRVSARKLLKHAWIVGSRRTDAPVPKPPANFNEAVEEVKQWNEALRSPNSGSFKHIKPGAVSIPAALRRDAPLRNVHNEQRTPIHTPVKGPLSLIKPKANADIFRSPEVTGASRIPAPRSRIPSAKLRLKKRLTRTTGDDNWDNDFTTSISPSALKLPHLKPHDNFAGLFSSDRLKSFASMDMNNDASDNWDENFEGDLITIKGPQRRAPEQDYQQELETIRPYPKKQKSNANLKPPPARPPLTRKRSSTLPQRPKPAPKHKTTQSSSKFALPARPVALFSEGTEEDYSDLYYENESVFDRRMGLSKVDVPEVGSGPAPVANVTKDEVLTPQLFHPSDLTSSHPKSPSLGGSLRQRPSTARPDILGGRDKPILRNNSALAIQRYAESERDEDFSDIFGGDARSERNTSETGSEDGATLMLHSKLSNNSWLGDEDEEDDPFASLEQGFDEMDLQANIARDKHARLSTMIDALIGSLKTNTPEDELTDKSEQLLDVLYETHDAKGMIISAHGMLPILEILELCTVKTTEILILSLLKVVNALILEAVDLQENLCFVGGIPIITKFTARQFSNEVRMEAAAFVRQMYQTSTLTLQMFVSAGGLNVLVEFLDEDYDEARDLVLIGVNGIWNVFELQGPTPKNDFCRIFSRSKILYPLSLVLNRVLDEDGEIPQLIQGRIVNIFYLFSQAENYVKEVVADRMTLKGVLKDLRRMGPVEQITMLKFIKNLSMLSTTLEALHSSNAIELLIDLLKSSRQRNDIHFREICNQVLNTMYNLCRLSKVRQEDAAVNGIIPLLMKIMHGDRPPKEFALPILCDMAHSGKIGRKHLWNNKGLQFYVGLLSDQYWQVTALDAIFIWLQEETARVEKHLLEGDFTTSIIKCFNTSKANNFDYNLLEPLQKLLRLSPAVAASLARFDMYTGILQKLTHKKAVVRLNFLRIVRSICDSGASEDGGVDIMSHPLFSAIEQLAEKDGAVLVSNMARELVESAVKSAQKNHWGHELHPAGRVGGRNAAQRRQSSYQNAHGSSLGQVREGLRDSPMTPNGVNGRPHTSHLGSLFAGDMGSPRRSGLALSGQHGGHGHGHSHGSHLSVDSNDNILHRPRSRDSNRGAVGGMESPFAQARKSSMEYSQIPGQPAVKSRLPRTALRQARSSMATPTLQPQPPPLMRESSSKSESGSSIGSREDRPRLEVRQVESRVRSDPSKRPASSGMGIHPPVSGGSGGHLQRRRRAPSTATEGKWPPQ